MSPSSAQHVGQSLRSLLCRHLLWMSPQATACVILGKCHLWLSWGCQGLNPGPPLCRAALWTLETGQRRASWPLGRGPNRRLFSGQKPKGTRQGLLGRGWGRGQGAGEGRGGGRRGPQLGQILPPCQERAEWGAQSQEGGAGRGGDLWLKEGQYKKMFLSRAGPSTLLRWPPV